MRELDRNSPSSDIPACARLAIVGRGRMGSALAEALGAAGAAGLTPLGPLGRGESVAEADADAVLLCVPDGQIAAAAALVPGGLLIGHCSGATGLAVLAPRERFAFHPLMTVTTSGARFAGAGAAVAGRSPRAVALAERLAAALGMRSVRIEDSDRAAYHAAASSASNFLVTLEAMAERMAAGAGVPRELLVALVRATVENWAALGPEAALTGPVARGDEATVARQRSAVADRAPELLDAFDALTALTRRLAGRPPVEARAA